MVVAGLQRGTLHRIFALVLIATILGANSVRAQVPPSVSLGFVDQPPASVVSGESFQISVELLSDRTRIADTDDSICLELVLPEGAENLFLGGTIGRPASNGFAFFDINVLNLAGQPVEGLRVRAFNETNPSMTEALSEPFEVVLTQGTGLKLEASDNRLLSSEVANSLEMRGHYYIEVEVQSADGEVDTSRNDSLNLSLSPGFDNVTLTGTTTADAVGGVAMFSDVALVGRPGLFPVTLMVTDKSESSVRPLYVSLGAPPIPEQTPVAIEVFEGPPSSVGEGEEFRFSVRLVDEDGIPVLMSYGQGMGPADVELLIADEGSYAESARFGDIAILTEGTSADIVVSIHDAVGNGFRIRVTDPDNPDLPPVVTPPFDVSGPAYFVFSRLPETLTGSGANLSSGDRLASAEDPLIVSVYDQDGDLWLEPMDVTVYNSPVSGTTTVTSEDGMAVFDDLVLESSEGAHNLALQVVPELSLYYYGQDYQWVETVESPHFNLMTPILLFTGDAEKTGDAVWRQLVPGPSEGDTGDFQLPYRFAGVQWNVQDYQEDEPLNLSGDPTGTTGFTVDHRWTLAIRGEIPESTETITGTITGTGTVGSAVTVNNLSALTEMGLSVDGALASLDKLPSGNYGMELVLESSEEPHYGTGDIYLIAGEVYDRREKALANARKPLRIGAVKPTIRVGEEVIIPVSIESAPGPFTGLAVHFDYDPEAIEIRDMTPAPGLRIHNSSIRRNGYISLWSDYSRPEEFGEGDTIFNIHVRGLKAGNWPISFVGNSSGWGIGDETSIAFQSTIGDTVFVSVIDPDRTPETSTGNVIIGRTDGTVRIAFNGSDLGIVDCVELASPDGVVQAVTHELERSENGARLTAVFGPTPSPLPAGVYVARLLDVSDGVVAEGQDVVVPPAVSFFSAYRDDIHPQIPGKPATHTWRVENHGTLNSVAIVLFGFRDYLAQPGKEPVLELDGAPDGTRLLMYGHTPLGYMAYVAVPVKAGSYVSVPWTIVLDPDAVFGANAELGVGKIVPFLSSVVGAFNNAQWSDFQVRMGTEEDAVFDRTALIDGSELWKRDTLQVLRGLDSLSEEELESYRDEIQSSLPSVARHLFVEGNLSFYRKLIPLLMEER